MPGTPDSAAPSEDANLKTELGQARLWRREAISALQRCIPKIPQPGTNTRDSCDSRVER